MTGSLGGGGEMGALMRELDWARTPLGPPAGWPAILRAAAGICLHSRFPMCLFWGLELAMLYNDAFRPILGASKHPAALGAPGEATWAEIWDYVGPLLGGVMTTGEATGAEDQRLLVDRNGYLEEAHFTFSYSAIPDDAGATRGVFVAVTETTSHVVSERRLRAAALLADRTADARTVEAVVAGVLEALSADPDDIPFARLRLDGRVVGTVGEAVDGADSARLALARPGLDGELVAGLTPHLAHDDAYREFLELLADQIAAALAGARGLEDERRRAAALEALDRAKTAFFSNVSHEFRTPLTLMLGPLADALSEPLPDAQRERVEIAHRSAERLLRLVNGLLDVSRLESGRARAADAAVDLAERVAEAASGFRSLVEQAGMTLTVEVPAEPVIVAGDRDMAEKIVFNLLSNAFKFTVAGAIRVTLARRESEAVLVVADTGAGIAPDELEHVFERFHRARAAEGRSHEGTGIGLALVRELVRLHGGTIAVESEPGAGSAFTVTLPLAPAGTPASAEPADPHGASTVLADAARWSAATPPVAGARVLVADDNADMRDYLARLLGDGYAVERVPDGRAALERARAGGLDLVLADVMMPGLDGFGLLRELRADPLTRRLPVIMVSARAGEGAAVEGLDAGADDYLVKPFAGSELRARVRATLELARLRDELDRRADAAEQVAEALQRSLLPDTLPELPELALAGRYVPAGRELRVGGDWYDAIPLPDGRIVLAIGDVAGHGVRAAAIMGQVSHALRAYAAEGHGPAELVRRLDALVLAGRLEMVTCLCAKLDPATGALRWVSAGHPPPLVAGPERATRTLQGPVANPLGVIVGSRHEEGEDVLADGETLVLYTDGLVERRDRPIDAGIAALAAALSRDGARLEAVCDGVLGALLDGAAPADDVALLVARRTRLTGAAAALTIPADPARLREVRHWLHAWLRGNGFEGRRAEDLVLAVHEASMNAVEHAYGSDPGTVELRVERTGATAAVEVRDRGHWRARPRGGDRGRGESLMHALADEVRIERGEHGSRVLLRTELVT